MNPFTVIAVIFVTLFAMIGVVRWREESRKEATMTACLKSHSVAECKGLR